MGKYIPWVVGFAQTMEAKLKQNGLGAGECRNLYSITAFGLGGNKSCGHTIDYMEDKFVLFEDIPDLVVELMAVRRQQGVSNCEDGWQATLRALSVPRRSQQEDQYCVQLLTVLITDEDRSECCRGDDDTSECCTRSKEITRTTLIRQLRQQRSEFAVIVDQPLYTGSNVPVLGGRFDKTGYVPDSASVSGFRQAPLAHVPRGFARTKDHYTAVALKRQINGTAWCSRCTLDDPNPVRVQSVVAGAIAAECANCTKQRGGFPVVIPTMAPITLPPTVSTDPGPMCSTPRPIVNARLIASPDAFPSPVGSHVLWQCLPGHRSERQQFQECTAIDGDSAEWRPENASLCTEITCLSLPQPANGIVLNTKSEHSPGDTVEVSCYRGYRLEGQQFPRCSPSGQWSTAESITPRCVAWQEPCTELIPALPANGVINLSPPSIQKQVNETATRACVILSVPETSDGTDFFTDHVHQMADEILSLNRVADAGHRFNSFTFCVVGVGLQRPNAPQVLGCVNGTQGLRLLSGQLTQNNVQPAVMNTLTEEVSKQVCNSPSEVRVDIIYQSSSVPSNSIPASQIVTNVNYRSSAVLLVTDKPVQTAAGVTLPNTTPLATKIGGMLAILQNGAVQLRTEGQPPGNAYDKAILDTGGWIVDSQYTIRGGAPRSDFISGLAQLARRTLIELSDMICRRCWCGSDSPRLTCTNLYILQGDKNCPFGRIQ